MPVSRDSKKKAAKQETLSSFLEEIAKDKPKLGEDPFLVLEAEEDEEEDGEEVEDDTEGEDELDLDSDEGEDEEGDAEEGDEEEEDGEEPEPEKIDFDANAVSKSIKTSNLAGELKEKQAVFRAQRTFADPDVIQFVDDVKAKVIENNPQFKSIPGIIDLIDLATKGLIATPTGEIDSTGGDLAEGEYEEEGKLTGLEGDSKLKKAVEGAMEVMTKLPNNVVDKFISMFDGAESPEEVEKILEKFGSLEESEAVAAGNEILNIVMLALKMGVGTAGLVGAGLFGKFIFNLVQGMKKIKKRNFKESDKEKTDDIDDKKDELEDVVESKDGVPESELYFVKNDANNQILGVFQDKSKAMNLKAHMNSFMKSSNLPEATKAFIAKSTGKKKMLMDMLKSPQNESEEFEECGPAPHHDFDMDDEGKPKIIVKVEKAE